MRKIKEWRHDHYVISTDNSTLDIPAIHHALTRSTWAAGIDEDTVRESIKNSLNFGVFDNGVQIGFARFITDYATFAYLCDVYILEEYQGKGLGGWLIRCCQEHPVTTTLRRMMLFTTTAPWLYQKLGYQPINKPNYAWAITRPDIYQTPKK
ncbi:GNAT family N-acetyltransferase [Acerihabitans sp. TG2]|uniref:GNAT family N-acetyltransferase n=1 Tax=Acerihabitans sp. TG2 TaxID=3096008 RepID=UPI002B23B8D7|nr:GNAT family N-acetyltransferase [Acerihabitans sp. TG2]MEA9389969.1 GNAT family N-acetyltransferase [Acerihabitans sp. TG2]